MTKPEQPTANVPPSSAQAKPRASQTAKRHLPRDNKRLWQGTRDELDDAILRQVAALGKRDVIGNTRTLVAHLRAAGIRVSNNMLSRSFSRLLASGRLTSVRSGRGSYLVVPESPSQASATSTPTAPIGPSSPDASVEQLVERLVDLVAVRVLARIRVRVDIE